MPLIHVWGLNDMQWQLISGKCSAGAPQRSTLLKWKQEQGFNSCFETSVPDLLREEQKPWGLSACYIKSVSSCVFSLKTSGQDLNAHPSWSRDFSEVLGFFTSAGTKTLTQLLNCSIISSCITAGLHTKQSRAYLCISGSEFWVFAAFTSSLCRWGLLLKINSCVSWLPRNCCFFWTRGAGCCYQEVERPAANGVTLW